MSAPFTLKPNGCNWRIVTRHKKSLESKIKLNKIINDRLLTYHELNIHLEPDEYDSYLKCGDPYRIYNNYEAEYDLPFKGLDKSNFDNIVNYPYIKEGDLI